jgi:membrane peptidoglycan carboxypeptidase
MPNSVNHKISKVKFKNLLRLTKSIGIVLTLYVLLVLWQLFPAMWRVYQFSNTQDIVQISTRKMEVPEHISNSFIASEDSHFFQHDGVEWKTIQNAWLLNWKYKTIRHGGSTITMQAARYAFLPLGRAFIRKGAEIPLALYMETQLTKAQILKLYLDNSYFGLGTKGLDEAAKIYFGKIPSNLTFAEACFLAGILPEPPGNRRKVTPEFANRCKNRTLFRLRKDTVGWSEANKEILHFVF